ncbi:tyrosine-type recombinase/integrase [Arthrobacter bambusae]|uniref:tyrosine-type recombinase/integrase n=1 Tax=Arthrobacter bambusae TaxID=1338426 RepID=UPI002784728F|nr:site-specific integrase [Arthrobacter bambusae]MDQ0212652.1 integrase [Arthrobacter bambusae]MDQ0237071.1 integrase [Arthrobacter bambusae]
MASIQKRENGSWRARYRDAAGKEHARHFTRKVDAQRWLDEVTASVVTGRYVDPKAGKMTFAQWFEQWAAAQVWARGTKLKAEQALAVATFRDHQIRAILPSQVQAWIKGMSTRLAPATVKVYYNLISSAFRAAVTDKVIAENPCVGAKLPRERRREAAMMIPTPAQLGKALEAAPDWFAPFISVCAFAGLRLGEAAGLQLADVDFLRRTISVSRQIQGSTKAEAEVVPPKHGSERVVFVAAELIQTLARHVETVGVFGDEKWLFGYGGTYFNRNSAADRWKQAREAAGIGEFTLHDLRHFYASGLIADGCDVVTVQRALGHAQPSITLNTYSHLWPTAEDKTRTAGSRLIAAVLGDSADSVRTTEATAP